MIEESWSMWVAVLEAVAIVTGNVTVLVVFTRTPSLRKRKHYPLVSLAVADLLVGMISVPMYVALFYVDYISAIKIIYKIQDVLFGTASVFGLAALAIERVYAVFFPFEHRTLRKSTYMIGIAVTWLMAILLAASVNYAKHFLHLVILAAITASLFVVIFSYTIIWVRMNCMTPIPNHAILGRDKKLTVTLLIVTAISMIAWIPFLIVSLMAVLGQTLDNVDTFVKATILCHYGNSLINPIIYALRMPDFKKAICIRWGCCGYYREPTVQSQEIHETTRASDIYLKRRWEHPESHYGNNKEHDEERRSWNENGCKIQINVTSYEKHSPSVNSSDFPCGLSLSEIKVTAVDNEGFIKTNEESKL